LVSSTYADINLVGIELMITPSTLYLWLWRHHLGKNLIELSR